MTGEAIGRVTVSRDPAFAVGDLIVHHHGWRNHAVLRATECRRVPELGNVDASAHLGILGMPGMAAFVGLFDIARFRPGDTCLSVQHLEPVGSAVGQFAKLNGASRVIGSAGSADKAAQLFEEFGFDDAFDYHQGPIAGLLADAAPDGIDVYYDNVGGEHLQAAFDALYPHGRIALCGATE
jgi:NADPH-dependent curcumin reductase CurA